MSWGSEGAPAVAQGHFGRPALNALIAVGGSIVAFFLVPFGFIEFRGYATPKDHVVNFASAQKYMDRAPDVLSHFSWSTTLVWVGLFLALLGAVLLVVMGQQPLKVDAARWIGSSGAFAIVLGGGLAFMACMYHVGTGFSTFLGALMQTEFRSQFWAISPVLVAAACAYAVHNALGVMVRVSANRDGIRDNAAAHASMVRWAMAFMGVVLVVPWAIGLMYDGVSDEVNFVIDGDDTAPLFFSAQDIQGATVSEMEDHGRLRFAREGDWQWLGTSLSVLVGAAWASFSVGLIGAFVGTLRSVGVGPGAETVVRALGYVVLVLWAIAALFYLASWFLAKPASSTSNTFLPGFWPILVPLAGYFVIKSHLAMAKAPAQQTDLQRLAA